MRVLVQSKAAVGFDFGLLPGVFLGSLLGALVGRDWTIEGFKDGYTGGATSWEPCSWASDPCWRVAAR